MASFPEAEGKVKDLAMSMMAGYTAHALDFPSADPVGLTAAFGDFTAAQNAHIEATAAARVATEAKNAQLAILEATMRAELKKSEVDTASDPEKLEFIGWGPRVAPSPMAPPSQPRNLDPTIQGPGTILLTWQSASHSTGGTARTYLVERRDEPSGGGEFGPWQQAGMAIDKQATLMAQPRGVQMEYRVKGVNTGGESIPSNTAPVVL
jgi:hypothetical protein